MFRFISFCRFFNILCEIFDFSWLVSLFSDSAKSYFEHQLLSKAIQNEQSLYKNWGLSHYSPPPPPHESIAPHYGIFIMIGGGGGGL